MTKPLAELIELFEARWPAQSAEQWDNPGLALGSPNQLISRVLLCVDVTPEVVQEAVATNCQLIFSHHPLFFHPVSDLSDASIKGELVKLAVMNSLAIFSAHTNADIAKDGVSEQLAKLLGLANLKPINQGAEGIGHGRIGNLETTLGDFVKLVASKLAPTNAPIRVAGENSKKISKVAVLAGAGDSFIAEAKACGADVLLTSDLRHHVVLDAIAGTPPIALVDVSHYAAEHCWLEPTAKVLAEQSGIEFVVSKIATDPWTNSYLGKP